MTAARNICLAIVIFVQGGKSIILAQPAGYPTPVGNSNQLFYLQRTHNKNTIVYELNFKNGKVNTEDPVHVFWLRYQERGQKEELSYIQRKFAYGLKSKKIAENQYELSLVSYKKYKIYLQNGADGKFHVYSMINKKWSLLTKIYIQTAGGTFWSPNVEYVEITGIDPATYQVVKERTKI